MKLELNTPLKAHEISFRIQSINKVGYATILAYKNARVDMDRLDAVYGVGYWQRKHEVINGNLFCRVGVYNKEIKEWVWVEDVGTQSITAKEKGQASDSFKRACTNLGIGRELYNYPSIQIQLNQNEYSNVGGKIKQSYSLNLNLWKWFTQFDEFGKLTFLMCRDSSNNIRFKYGKYDKTKDKFEVKQDNEQEHYTNNQQEQPQANEQLLQQHTNNINTARSLQDLQQSFEFVSQLNNRELNVLYSNKEIQLKNK